MQKAQLFYCKNFPKRVMEHLNKMTEFEHALNGHWVEYKWVSNPNAHKNWVFQNFLIDEMGFDLSSYVFENQKILLNWSY